MIKLKNLIPESKSTKTIDAYEMEMWFRGWVENEIDEEPNQTMDLLFAYKKRKTSLKTTMSWTEEVKDGRSPYFNEKVPLRLKGKTFDDEGVQTTITSIKLIDKSSQDSDYNDYQVTSYDVTFKIKYGKDAPIFESKIKLKDPVTEVKKPMVVTSIKDIANIKKLVDQGKVTYKGLGMGKKFDDFYDLANTNGTQISIGKNNYYITDADFKELGGQKKIKFKAPFRRG